MDSQKTCGNCAHYRDGEGPVEITNQHGHVVGVRLWSVSLCGYPMPMAVQRRAVGQFDDASQCPCWKAKE